MCVLLCRDASQAYRQRLIELGYADVAADAEALAKIVEGAKAVADKKKTLSDQDLEALVGDKLYSSPPTCVQRWIAWPHYYLRPTKHWQSVWRGQNYH